MLLEISHFTHYRYASPVTLMPHIFRLRPREDGSQRLHAFQLNLEPAAGLLNTHLEPDGNVGLKAWFPAPLFSLRVHVRATVETHRTNPYDYLISSLDAMTLPVKYDARWQPVLAAALQPLGGERVKALAEAVAEKAQFDTLRFLNLLNRRLHETVRCIVRVEGPPMGPEETLERGEAACRDMALVFMAACRHFGVAARFVSGYQMVDPNQRERYMHAWAEVFLPGGGWRGYDPTHGVAVDDHFVAVAASPISSLAAPIEGSYVPIQIASELEVHLDVRGSCPVPRVPHNPASPLDKIR